VPEVAEGVQAVVNDIRAKLPDSKILLLAIFPRGTPDNPQRAQVALVNTVIARLDDGKMVKYLDIDPKFSKPTALFPRTSCPICFTPTNVVIRSGPRRMEPTLEEMLK